MKTSRSARYIYLMTEGLPSTVIDSQVMDPLRQMASRGLVLDLITFTDLRSFWQDRAGNLPRLERAQRDLSPARIWLHPAPSPIRLFGRVWLCVWILLHLLPDILSRRSIVCHCRGHYSAFVGHALSRLLRRFSFVFDVRGDTAAELQVLFNWAGTAEQWRASKFYLSFKAREQAALVGAQEIICVSEFLRQQLERECSPAAGKITVIPCLASEQLFYFDPAMRSATRSALGLTGSKVIVYAGGLSAPWHLAKSILGSFKLWAERDGDLHLLLVTPDRGLAERLVAEQGVSADRVSVVMASHHEVAGYLLAGDVGLLLRQADPLNRVASPTKFAEYTMTGLPVLASAGVGDLNEIIISNRLGVLVDVLDDPELLWQQLQAALGLPASDAARHERAETAKQIYSAERAIDDRLALYRRASSRFAQGQIRMQSGTQAEAYHG